MKISKPFEWTRTFIEVAQKKIPELRQLRKLYVIGVTKTKKQQQSGNLFQYVNTPGYFIGMYSQYQFIVFNPLTVTIKPLSKLDILAVLAHELAHIITYKKTLEHTVEHARITNRIHNIFLSLLKKQGYISEEKEK